MSGLKLCPFCGEPPRLRRASNAPSWWILGCEDGRCAFKPEVQSSHKEELAELWNCRKGDRVDELVEALGETHPCLYSNCAHETHGECLRALRGWIKGKRDALLASLEVKK